MTGTATPGWYDDGSGRERWWDGSAWTDNWRSGPVGGFSVEKSGRNGHPLPVIVLVLGLAALLLFVVPYLGVMVSVGAVVAGILALGQRRGKVAQSGWGLVLGAAAFVPSLLISIVFTTSLAQSTSAQPVASQAAPETAGEQSSKPSTAREPVEKKYAIGEEVPGPDGVMFTVTSTKCGLATVGESFMQEKASGQFCAVSLTVTNQGTKPREVTALDLVGLVRGSEYEAKVSVSTIGNEYFFNTVNPGLAISGVLYYDVPASATLDQLRVDTSSLASAPVIELE